MTYRVIQWSTGNVGRYALRGILAHPELELVGVWAHSPSKVGRDAGELAGVEPVGIAATADVESLLALDADCVSYTATADLRPDGATEDIVRILQRGTNVVSSSLVFLVYPPAADPGLVHRFRQACDQGGASFFTSGIDPGFANDALPLMLSGLCERAESVHVQEVLNYATYDQPEVLFGTMGFGMPLDHVPLLLLPGVLTLAWGPVVHAIAAGLGVAVDHIEEHHERVPASETFTIPSGTVQEGTTAGLRFELRGMCEGKTRVVLEHVTRLRDDVAPHWPAPPGKGGYRVHIDGSPSIRCELTMEGDGGDENSGGLIATAMRLVNAIPAVCEAAPGLLSPFDLPLITPGMPGR